MRLAQTGIGVSGLVAGTAGLLAVATLWLVLTDPLTVADALAGHDPMALATAVADVILAALRQAARWL